MKDSAEIRIDPALRRQLESAESLSSPISAVVKLRPEDPSASSLPPARMNQVTRDVLERVRKCAGEKEKGFVVLDALGAFNLVAPVRFVIELLKQPEVASAFSADAEAPKPNRPVNSKEVFLEAKSGSSRGH